MNLIYDVIYRFFNWNISKESFYIIWNIPIILLQRCYEVESSCEKLWVSLMVYSFLQSGFKQSKITWAAMQVYISLIYDLLEFNVLSSYILSSFEIRRESASLTRAWTRQNHFTRIFSGSHRRFVRLSLSNDNFHNNLLFNNSNTLIFHFFWQTESVKEMNILNQMLKHVLCFHVQRFLNAICFSR